MATADNVGRSQGVGLRATSACAQCSQSMSHLQQGAVIANDGRLPNDYPGAMVQQDAVADAGSRVDVDGKHLTDAALQHEGHHMLAPEPQAVPYAVRLDGVEALVVQQRLAVRPARWVLRATAAASDTAGACSCWGGKDDRHTAIRRGYCRVPPLAVR